MYSDPLILTARVGCRFVYETKVPTYILLVFRPRMDGNQRIRAEKISFSPAHPLGHFEDAHGNLTYRAALMPGRNEILHDALVSISDKPDNYGESTSVVPTHLLPPATLRYTLPSRYCDSDKLMDFAWQNFSSFANGLDRVVAICNWVHFNIEYRFGSGRPDLAASEVIARRFGVCRDFAHVAIALCRCFNLPARYVTGHLPDIGFQDPGTPMDFHAYFEVYLGNGWLTFDARFNVPRIGRIKLAHGLDAVDGAFSTTYGQATLSEFYVWAYQVKAGEVSVGDPVDMSKRLDGTPVLRYI